MDALRHEPTYTEAQPKPMELIGPIGEGFGFPLYKVHIQCSSQIEPEEHLRLSGLLAQLKGRARFFRDDDGVLVPCGKALLLTGSGSKLDDHVDVDMSSGGMLTILVENPGRVNFENTQPLDGERKGLLGAPMLSVVTPSGYSAKCKLNGEWEMTPIPMKPGFIKSLPFNDDADINVSQPTFIKFELYILEDATDTFIDPLKSGFTKGVIFVNGRNLGRYWSGLGPQETLYLPGPWLDIGINEIIVFDEAPTNAHYTLHFTAQPRLGPKNKRPS